MPQYEYVVTARESEETHAKHPWQVRAWTEIMPSDNATITAATGPDVARAWLADKPAGTEARIERRIVGTVGRSGCHHPLLTYRTYDVGSNGIVRRTDR